MGGVPIWFNSGILYNTSRECYEPQCESKSPHIFVIAAELSDDDIGDLPATKDPIQEHQGKAMGAACSLTIPGGTRQREQDGL